MTLNDAEIAALESGAQSPGIFFRLDTDPIVRLWLGFGPIEPGINVRDLSGATYNGMGELQNIPALKQLINGKAERVDFMLSGVSGQMLQVASGGDAQQVKGKTVAIGFALMGNDWQLLGPVKWVQNYTADYVSLSQSMPESPDEPVTRTISLSCGSILTARRRPALSYFSNQDQQARHPGDRFCERATIYANGFNKSWPIF